jgi:toxin ParE1/3/4
MAHASWLSAAERDLDEILAYIAVGQGRPLIAEQIAHQVREKCDLLANAPMLGEARPELGPELRLFSYRRWAIVYRPTSSGVKIVGIVDCARDFADYFRSR